MSLGRQITGAGSTFVYPLVAKWASAYTVKHAVEVNYQSIGSGGGITQIVNQTVDFGCTDVPLDEATLKSRGLAQFPLVAGAIVPAINLPGIADATLRLTGDVLARIYLGEITRWNDPVITRLNPALTLPDRLITVIHRADGSGTSFIWTSYLTAVSPKWRRAVGRASAVEWPTGVGGKGNEGVAAYVKQTVGAIGYVESAFARRAQLTTARLMNHEGKFVAGEQRAFAAALHQLNWAKSPVYDVTLVDPPGADSWPIVGATFVLVPRKPKAPADLRAALDFFAWAYREGTRAAEEMHYVPLAEDVRRRIVSEWPARLGI